MLKAIKDRLENEDVPMHVLDTEDIIHEVKQNLGDVIGYPLPIPFHYYATKKATKVTSDFAYNGYESSLDRPVYRFAVGDIIRFQRNKTTILYGMLLPRFIYSTAYDRAVSVRLGLIPIAVSNMGLADPKVLHPIVKRFHNSMPPTNNIIGPVYLMGYRNAVALNMYFSRSRYSQAILPYTNKLYRRDGPDIHCAVAINTSVRLLNKIQVIVHPKYVGFESHVGEILRSTRLMDILMATHRNAYTYIGGVIDGLAEYNKTNK